MSVSPAIVNTPALTAPVSAAIDAHLATLHASELPQLDARRRQGRASLASIGLPTRRHEEWRYFDLRPVHQLTPSARPASADRAKAAALVDAANFSENVYRVVFVNGLMEPSLCRTSAGEGGVTVASLRDALRDDPTVAELLAQLDGDEALDGTVALGRAVSDHGALIRVAADGRADRPVHIIHVYVGGEAQAWTDAATTLVQLAPHASAHVVETTIGCSETQVLSLPQTFARVDQGASLEWTRIQEHGAQATEIARQRFTLDRDATLNSVVYARGATRCRDTLEVTVSGSGATARIAALTIASGDQTIDHHTVLDHRVPHTSSNQLYKYVLDDASRGVFNGKVFVRQDAQLTAAEQLNNNLILSDSARVDAKPQLEIFADDVKCAHGATVGQLDPEHAFYLQSRGISPEMARELLVRAFSIDVLDRITNKPLRDRLTADLIDALTSLHPSPAADATTDEN